MPSIHLPTLALLLFLFSLLTTLHASSNPFVKCSTDSNFTTNSTYHSNLNLLFPSLITAAVPSGYANRSAGRFPDQAFGLALCRGDVSPEECQACLTTAVDDLRSFCPSGKDAASWEDHCYLAYSNTNFSGDSNKSSYSQTLFNTGEIPLLSFAELVEELMDGLIDWAAHKSERKFAMGAANLTSFVTVYGLVQCTPSQSGDDCYQCLRASLQSMQSCCWHNQGGVVLKYRCYLRYETYPYLNTSVATAPLPASAGTTSPPPPPPPRTDTISPLPPPAVKDSGNKENSKRVVLAVIPTLCALMSVSLLLICFLRRRKSIRQSNAGEEQSQYAKTQLFHLDTLRVATDNFSDANKLGEGGFGPVYKGVLPDGHEVAVKRLSRSSQQGLSELRNEVTIVAKLQHRNLARLLGCCLEEEKLLVYEFLPNTSLDKILFDSRRCGELNWERRYKISEGIARGLHYLHEDSLLNIIHRDLKPGNILLNQYMIPKISDFGLSKLLDNDRSKASASRIVGTNGYIAPEYALHRHFSTKSDVYSYGILVLEIITGRRITDFHGTGHHANLQTYAWKCWNEGKAVEIIDQNLGGRYHQQEALRCIEVALLCVQDDPSKRPSMASVVLMLNSFSVTHPPHSAPGFLIDGSRTSGSNELTRSSCPIEPGHRNKSKSNPLSVNGVSVTEMEPR